MKEQKAQKLKNNKGITLIALVITIIVMLILVAVTITMAVNGGLFGYAQKAVGDTKNKITDEQILANGTVQVDGELYNSVDDYIKGIVVERFSEVYEKNITITEGKYKAVIPTGFSVGISKGINTISDGLVVKDEDGDEFVWIPVTYTVTGIDSDNNGYDDEFDKVFYRSLWADNERTTGLSTDYKEPYEGGYVGEDTEYEAMVSSVYKNGGFYIGRYEAGIKTTDKARTSTTTGSSKVVIRRDCYPYNYVGWGNAINNYDNDIIYNPNTYNQTNGTNFGNGAVYLSKHLLDGQETGAVSTLCYGVQWDAMLDFIKDKDHSVTSCINWGNFIDNPWTINRASAQYYDGATKKWISISELEKKSLTKSNSESYLLTTGASENFKSKNIYDVAGNCFEWTMEGHAFKMRVIRGGTCVVPASYYSVSYRPVDNVYGCYEDIGFRPALYISPSEE